MSVFPSTEQRVTFTEVARRYPGRAGKKRHLNVIVRWHREGVSGVTLEAEQFAGLWYTTEEALRRFQRAVDAARAGRKRRGSAPAGFGGDRSDARRGRDSARAAAYNDRAARQRKAVPAG